MKPEQFHLLKKQLLIIITTAPFISWNPAFSTFVKKELQRIDLMSKDEILSMFHCSTSDLLQNDGQQWLHTDCFNISLP